MVEQSATWVSRRRGYVYKLRPASRTVTGAATEEYLRCDLNLPAVQGRSCLLPDVKAVADCPDAWLAASETCQASTASPAVVLCASVHRALGRRLLVSLRTLARLRKCSIWVDDLHHAGLAVAAEEGQLAASDERAVALDRGSQRCSERCSAPLRRLRRVGAWLRSEAGAEAVVVVSEETEKGGDRGENEADGEIAPTYPPPPQSHSSARPPDDVAALLASLDAGASRKNDVEDLLDQLDLGGSTSKFSSPPAEDDFDIASLLAELDVKDSGAPASAAAPGRPEDAPPTALLSPGVALERYFGASAAVMEALAARRTGGAPCRSPLAAAYAAHLSPAALEAGLERGSLLRGPALVWRSVGGDWLGTVKVCMGDGEHAEVGIQGRERLNRALHGDTVVVQLLPAGEEGPGGGHGGQEAECGAAPELSGVGLHGGDADGVGESASSDQTAPSPAPASATLQGRVVGVLRRATEVFAACVTAEQEGTLEGIAGSLAMRTLRCIPSNRRLPLFALSTRRAGTLAGARFALRFADWDASSELPAATLVKVLGPRFDPETETRALLLECGLGSDGAGDVAESLDVAKEVEAEVALLAEQVDEEGAAEEATPPGGGHIPVFEGTPAPSSIRLSPEDRAQRRDLRDSTLVFSVDPPGCTDVDDAMSVREVRGASGARLVEVGVHIADVCAWVREGGSLDRAAAQKGTTIYLPGRRLDMLPGLLSEDVCSLRQGRTRRAVSVLWRLHPHDLRVAGVWMGRTLLRSAAQLEYRHAQEMLADPRGGADRVRAALLDSKLPAPTQAQLRDVSSALGVLQRLADARRAARLERGAVELESAEMAFAFAPGSSQPRGVTVKRSLPAMALVAELMIMANEAVARKLGASLPLSALLRSHSPPSRGRVEELDALRRELGLESPLDPAPRRFAASLRAAVRECGSAVEKRALLLAAATRAMSEAVYVAGGSSESRGHFGLALEWYTHFTSPIRRYADVLVHRQLLQALSRERGEAGGPGKMPGAEACSAVPVSRNASSAAPLSHIASSGIGPSPSQAPRLLPPLAQHLNSRHRAAKRAQLEASLLQLCLLVSRQPRVERAVVSGIAGEAGFRVFVPAFGVQATVAVMQQDGSVVPPLERDEDADATGEKVALDEDTRARDRNSSAPPSTFVVRVGATRVCLCSPAASFLAAVGDRIWVRLESAPRRALPMQLAVRWLAPSHAAVAAKVREEEEAAALAETGKRAVERNGRASIRATMPSTAPPSDATSPSKSNVRSLFQIYSRLRAPDASPVAPAVPPRSTLRSRSVPAWKLVVRLRELAADLVLCAGEGDPGRPAAGACLRAARECVEAAAATEGALYSKNVT